MTVQSILFPPSSEWKPPELSSLPDPARLAQAKFLGLDTETFDPNLMEMGPGGARNDGMLVGVSFATPEGKAWYLPMSHLAGGNLPVDNTKRYLNDVLSRSVPKVGANILYDLEWLRSSGIKTNGPFFDIQIAEPLLDENRRGGYSLEKLSQSYLGKGKDEQLLKDAAAAFGLDPKGEMWKLHSKFVGPYAEADAIKPVLIAIKQLEKIKKKGLEKVFQLELDLLPILLDMRFQGVAVDVDRAERLNNELLKVQLDLGKKLSKEAGFNFSSWKSKHCEKAFNSLGISFPRTESGNPSFTGDWLRAHEHPFAKGVSDFRRTSKMRRDFIEGGILRFATSKGRIHGSFHQLRQDKYGTRSGRFSSSNPNLQQVPSRDPYWGPLIRGLFIPDQGCRWGRFDYSQQEPRVLLHYAEELRLPGSSEAAERYRRDPGTDYHSLTQSEIGAFGLEIDRFQAKTLNLGMAYRMGLYKLAQQLGCDSKLAERILDGYHGAKPYVSKLAEACEKEANRKGFIITLLGRHRNFGHGHNTYQAGNSLIQGSSADITKQAMRDCYKAGYLPHIQVHDELDFSIPEERTEQDKKQIVELMNNCVQMNVPLATDAIIGNNWGECK